MALKDLIRPLYYALRGHISRQRVRKHLRSNTDIFVEVGAGDKKGENGWLTIDMTQNCDIFWDLRNGMPFPNESVAKIYSSHFLEHLSFKEAQVFLDECLRVLVDGGLFSICVPNAKLFIEAYSSSIMLDPNTFLGYKQANNNTTSIDYVNYIAYMDGHHKYMFDQENLLFILKSKGFKEVRSRGFDPALDLKQRDLVSIYAEALK